MLLSNKKKQNMADFKTRFKGKTSCISRDGNIKEAGKPSLPIQRRAKLSHASFTNPLGDEYNEAPMDSVDKNRIKCMNA